MRIIEQARAPNPRRVRIFLAEKGIQVPFQQIDLTQLQHRTEDYRRINPAAQVPVLLLDDGTAISESVAICRYFEELQPEPALFGAGAVGRAQVEMWNRRIEHGVYAHILGCFRHTHKAMAALESPQVPAWGEVCRSRAAEALKPIDRELRDSQFIAGSALTVADITLLVAVDFMKPARIDRPAGLSGLDRWYAEVSARPSAAA
jgi:glutathione S-transferase